MGMTVQRLVGEDEVTLVVKGYGGIDDCPNRIPRPAVV